MKNISRKAFEKINFYPVSNPPVPETSVYISIHGNDPYEKPKPRVNRKLWLDGIQLQFDDIDTSEPENNLYTISDDQADSVVSFINRIHSDSTEVDLIIHCYAGISRSAAVGKFVNDTLKLEFPNYNRLMIYNRAVYSQLLKAWRRFVVDPNKPV